MSMTFQHLRICDHCATQVARLRTGIEPALQRAENGDLNSTRKTLFSARTDWFAHLFLKQVITYYCFITKKRLQYEAGTLENVWDTWTYERLFVAARYGGFYR
jgi:hypothetical protein